MNRFVKISLAIVMMCITSVGALSQTAERLTRAQYIEAYKGIAIEQMIEKGIPASITLAQACLESADGNSTLAVEANNHFGIKCHAHWKGETIAHDAESGKECFRKYGDAKESFSDHSDFLRYSDRYSFLFEIDRTDYKGWAYGLKKAGYATDPAYPAKLIKIIEENDLGRFDVLEDSVEVEVPPTPIQAAASVEIRPGSTARLYKIAIYREVFEQNGVPYIIATNKDSYGFLAGEYNLFKGELLRFNDLDRDEPLQAGTRVYLEKKKRSSARHLDKHVVEEGETMYGLSQRYAIQLKYLYQYNNMRRGEEPAPGTVLLLRKSEKHK